MHGVPPRAPQMRGGIARRVAGMPGTVPRGGSKDVWGPVPRSARKCASCRWGYHLSLFGDPQNGWGSQTRGTLSKKTLVAGGRFACI